MSAKIIMITGLLGVAGYVGYGLQEYDPDVFPMSKEVVVEKLLKAKAEIPTKKRNGVTKFWAVGRTTNGIKLRTQSKMSSNYTTPGSECDIAIDEIGPEETRVTAMCGLPQHSDSALADTTSRIGAPMFEEHIFSTLTGKPYDMKKVTAKKSALVMKNMGGMQREALKKSDEIRGYADNSDDYDDGYSDDSY